MVTSVAGVLTFTDLRVDAVGNYSLLFEIITGASDFVGNSDPSDAADEPELPLASGSILVHPSKASATCAGNLSCPLAISLVTESGILVAGEEFSVHPTPHTLHPTPYTLHPNPKP